MCEEVSESQEVTRTDVAQYVKSLMSEISLETGVQMKDSNLISVLTDGPKVMCMFM